jgi:formate dehydrogenase iron-sulfur subunit
LAVPYGEKEVGGTDWLYLANVPFDKLGFRTVLANVPFDKLGFRTDLGERAYPEYANLALDAVPPAVIGVGAVLGGVYWVSNRRSEAENAGLPGDTSPEE